MTYLRHMTILLYFEIHDFGDPPFQATTILCAIAWPPIALAGSHSAGSGCSSGVSVSQKCAWAALGMSL